MQRLEEVLSDRFDSHLIPFFWQKGQTDEVNRTYIQQMYEQGIRCFCVESRPHPDFLGDGWWHTMDVILEEARMRDMRIWILDDAQFPTGYANGKVPEHLKKRYLACSRIDFEGSHDTLELDVSTPAGFRALLSDRRHASDELVACVLVENDLQGGWVAGSARDVTDKVVGHSLRLSDTPLHASVILLYETICGQEQATQDYLDPMRAEATDILINEVYESHYAHFSRLFGNTITAFFSDEPRFGNSGLRTEVIGSADSTLPWNEEVAAQLLSVHDVAELAYLFGGAGSAAHRMRYDYMDVVSELYERNFSQRLGEWCARHGVQYVGHVIEDDNAHARIGQGAGHYFRAMAGQDYAGVDVIGGQVVPGMDYRHSAFSKGGCDGEFYHYALCRLAASAAKLDPKKRGRALCEAFGAYGWSEGLQEMKWITDHLLSHGINAIVPHAFSPAAFPDLDCPPHFYAHGNNPQWPYFGRWAHYADRLCHLLSGGEKVARVAVLYHAAAEWMCGTTMYVQAPCRMLQQAQIDSDIVSEELLASAVAQDSTLLLAGHPYDALVVPACDGLPQELITHLLRLAGDARVLFVDARPAGCEGVGEVVTLEELPQALSELALAIEGHHPHLNAYRYRHDDGEVWMLTNESPRDAVETVVSLEVDGPIARFDAFDNDLVRLPAVRTSAGWEVGVHLAPYESLVIVTAEAERPRTARGSLIAKRTNDIAITAQSFDATDEQPIAQVVPEDLQVELPDFSGTLAYRFDVEFPSSNVLLTVEGGREVVEVQVNGVPCGARICPPYEFDLSAGARLGTNRVEVRQTGTLARSQRDFLSLTQPLGPVGITKSFTFYAKEQLS